MYITIDINSVTQNASNALFVIDMQNDFCNPDGNFYVKEGEQTVKPITELMEKWNGPIIASIDYHPPGHCSFTNATHLPNCSGPFPSHCTWGSTGAILNSNISNALNDKNAMYVYKGFMNNLDSFGAVQYPNNSDNSKYPCGRIASCTSGQGFSSGKETGGFLLGNNELQYSNLNYPNETQMKAHQENIDNDNNTGYESIDKYILEKFKDIKNIYVVGLAGDYCVLDTVRNLNFLFSKSNIKTKVYYVINYTRVAWLPGDKPSGPKQNLYFKNGNFLTPPTTIGELGESLCKFE